MPSPFPGMDPYLEQPGLWRDVHLELISGIRAELSPRLHPKFHARVEERVYIEKGDDSTPSRWIPDVTIVPRPGQDRAQTQSPEDPVEAEVVGVAVAEPIVVITRYEEEVHEPYLVIFESQSREAIAVIEVVSPSNKAQGSEGRKNFEQKRLEVLNSSCHWIEIDLLRAGTPLMAVPPSHQPYEYLVHISQYRQRPQALLWPIRLSQRLPVIPIPLRPDDEEVSLDLQAVLNAAYDRAWYGARIDYRQEPDPPLEGEWAAWADRWLRKRGMR